MTFSNLSLAGLVTGLLVIAGVLFLLQRLRVRYRERTVVTTLFWKQALEEARRRVLVRRFKHPLAYLFVLLICSLLWLGFGQPRTASSEVRSHVILLDGSAAMGRGQRFAETVDLALAHAGALPADQRRVILCAGRPRPLLEPGENPLLVRERLGTFVPEACPASVERTVRALTRGLSPDSRLSIVVAGDAPIRATLVDLLPQNVDISRITPESDDASANNRAITALGVAPAASGAWDRVDVLVEVASRAAGAAELEVTLDGKPAELAASRSRSGTNQRIVFADVPATGQLLLVRLRGSDAIAADDSALLQLPVRRRIRVALDPDLRDAVGPVLAADPGVLETQQDPDVWILAADAVPASGPPALVFVPIGAQDDAIVVHTASPRIADASDTFDRLGIDQVDAVDVAQVTGRRISIASVKGSKRALSVWRPLISTTYNFVQSRSFPLFVANGVRWLAGIESEPSYVGAGEPVAGVTDAHTDASGKVLDPAGADFVPPTAGVYTSRSGRVIAASLPAAAADTTAAELAAATTAGTGSGSGDWALWLGLVVLLLLIGEWYAYGTGRMP